MSELAYHFIDPVLFRLGPLEIRWYGVMYLIGFICAYFIIRLELQRKNGPIPVTAADDLLFHLILGLLLGARIGYALIYNLPTYAVEPWEIFAVWRGGMSFHGGLVGMVIAGLIFSRKYGASFWDLADIGAISATPGLFFGRIGNFINGELFGRLTDLPWGVVFPLGGPIARHPSQLYEAILEGPVLFLFLWWLRLRTKRSGQILAAFSIGYGLVRFLVEFFREPDSQIGYIMHWFTMGQLLCLGMIAGGFGLLVMLKMIDSPAYK